MAAEPTKDRRVWATITATPAKQTEPGLGRAAQLWQRRVSPTEQQDGDEHNQEQRGKLQQRIGEEDCADLEAILLTRGSDGKSDTETGARYDEDQPAQEFFGQ